MIGANLLRRLDEFYSDDWQPFVPMIGKTWINRYFVIQIKPLPQAPRIRGQPPGAFVFTLFSLSVNSFSLSPLVRICAASNKEKRIQRPVATDVPVDKRNGKDHNESERVK